MYYISALAETNRAPFDLPEAEAELVAGYNVEYSAMGFALFFLGEYANMIIMSAFGVILFLGGWLPPFDIILFNWIPPLIWFGLKTLFLLFVLFELVLHIHVIDMIINAFRLKNLFTIIIRLSFIRGSYINFIWLITLLVISLIFYFIY